jgi:hypothetical protein
LEDSVALIRYGQKLPPLIQSDDDGSSGVSSGRDLVMDGGGGVRFGTIEHERSVKPAGEKTFWYFFNLIGKIRNLSRP